jgi:hypothetical protein
MLWRFKEGHTGVSVSTDKLLSTTLLELLNNLKLAVAQLRLYPKDSPQVVKVAAAAFQALSATLDQNPKLILAATPNGLIINGQRLGAKDFATVSLESSFISILLDAGIKSIVFRKGAALEEFLTFLDALVRKFWDIKDGKEINRLLLEHQVSSIGVEEIEYVALSEGDLLI